MRGIRRSSGCASSRLSRAILLLLAGVAVLAPVRAWASDVYVSNAGSDSISPFATGANGALSPISCSEMSCATGSGPAALAVRPDGRFLYASNQGDDSISPFAIGADGSLTPVACGAKCELGEPVGLATSPDGRLLFATVDGSFALLSYPIASDGTLGTFRSAGTGASPRGVAISADGRFAYVANEEDSNVSQFSVGADGTLTPIPCAPASNCATGTDPEAIAASPDGRFIYAANGASDTVSPFSISSNGSLSPIACAAPNCNTGDEPAGLAVTPDGRFLYTANRIADSVSSFSIGANGSLNPIACSVPNCDTALGPRGIAVSPDGRFLYVSNYTSDAVSVFSIAADGSLSAIECPGSDCDTQGTPAFQSIAVRPDQAPVAAFSATPAPTGQATVFDGSASSPSAGRTVARYDWSFGDGSDAHDAGPHPTHAYTESGTYTVGLTVTDDAGCSTAETFTGQTASCDGGPSARASRSIMVPAPAPPSGTESPGRFPPNGFSLGRVRLNRKRGTAALTVELPGPGALTLAGKGLRPLSRRVTAGETTLQIIPTKTTRKREAEKHRVKVTVSVTFVPVAGEPRSQHRMLKLIKRS